MNRGNHINAFILAGGKSKRMGSEKGLMEFRGKELIKHSIEILKPVFKEVYIIANDPAYMKFGMQVYKDRLNNLGPIGGIYTALTMSLTPWNFIIACDMPFMNQSVIDKLLLNCKSTDMVVPVQDGQREPLSSLYHQSCVPVIEQQIAGGNFKLQDLISKLNCMEIDFNLSGHNPFRNLNTIQELNNFN